MRTPPALGATSEIPPVPSRAPRADAMRAPSTEPAWRARTCTRKKRQQWQQDSVQEWGSGGGSVQEWGSGGGSVQEWDQCKRGFRARVGFRGGLCVKV